MKKFQPDHSGEHGSYRTGSTRPPKSHQGTIALLLALVIFLGGTVSALGMLNIRLFRMLKAKEAQDQQSSARFSADTQAAQAQSLSGDEVENATLGISGQVVSELYRCYNGWPQGIYISRVTPGSPAAQAKLSPGDILISLDGNAIANEEDFRSVLSALSAGRVHAVTIYRNGSRITLPLSLGV